MTTVFIVTWTFSDWDGELTRIDSVFDTEEQAQKRVERASKERPDLSWDIEEFMVNKEG